jgi:A/G-specific adenine glycosylase
MAQSAASSPQDNFAASLVAWQREHGRHTLPWQRTVDPYRVWLSEVMLQQTQVTTVLGYYERFLQRFPDVAALAAAPQDDVFALWSGLGYYSRARNLHACAKAVVEKHGGAFPRTSAELVTLPGIGRSTAAAIAAFCFGERIAIFDGNVKRVLSRYLAFGADLSVAANERVLWAQAEEMVPHEGVESYTQGLMDLGATVCLPRMPTCLLCPVADSCRGRMTGAPEQFPVKTRKLKRGTRENAWLWLQWGDKLWLSQRPDSGVWASLWSLPEFASDAALAEVVREWPGKGLAFPSFKHVLTHLDWTLHPRLWTLPEDTPARRVAQITQPWSPGRWVTLQEALALGLPSPLRKLLLAQSPD